MEHTSLTQIMPPPPHQKTPKFYSIGQGITISIPRGSYAPPPCLSYLPAYPETVVRPARFNLWKWAERISFLTVETQTDADMLEDVRN